MRSNLRRLRTGLTVGAAGLLAWLSASPAGAQNTPAKDGLFISVPNPITSEAVQQIQQKVTTAVEGPNKRNITTVVFAFNPQGVANSTIDFGPCYSLADYIRQLRLGQVKATWPRMTTVAFLQHEVSKHSVLPVLACENQIIMSGEVDSDTRVPKARLGGVTRGLDSVLNKTQRAAYREFAESYPSPDVIQRMLDPQLPLRRAKTNQGERYLSPDSVKELEKQLISVEAGAPPGLQPGQDWFDADQALELKLCRAIYNSRAEVAAALQLPRQALSEDWLAGMSKVVWVVEVRGPLDAGKVNSLRRRINRAKSHNANYIILQLDSEGGETRDVASLANELREMKIESGTVPIKFVAWVPPGRALGASTFLALACSEIVLGKDAALGDFGYLSEDEQADTRRRAGEMLADLARAQGYPPLLFQATLDPKLTLIRVKSKTDRALEQLITEKAFQDDQQAADPRWDSFGRLVPADGKNFKVSAALAREMRVALATDIDRLDDLYSWCGLSDQQQHIRVARDDWLDQIAELFREPWVRFLLIMLGIIGLILELKMPGATLPGTLSAVCFVLFFWAYSFVGEFTFLAVLLFILGLVLIAVEIFIIPGVSVPGIAGVVLVIFSLVLVTLEKMPETSQDWVNLGATLTTFGLSMAAALAGAFMLAWYLPNIPYANRLILQPPADDAETADSAGAVAPNAGLLGAIGVAATPLRPAGKVQFGEDFLDVVAEGDYVNAGCRVQVIEIEGNRIVVKEV